MSANSINLTKDDLENLIAIVRENNLSEFTLLYDGSSGIGYTVDVAFHTDYNGYNAQVKIPLVTVDRW